MGTVPYFFTQSRFITQQKCLCMTIRENTQGPRTIWFLRGLLQLELHPFCLPNSYVDVTSAAPQNVTLCGDRVFKR